MASARVPGNLGPSVWRFGGLSTRQLAKNWWHEILQDDVLGRSAQLAYFFFFAVFPLAISVTALLGFIAGPHSPLAHHLTAYATRTMPRPAAALVKESIRHSFARTAAGKLTFGILVSLLSASSGMAAMIDTLNSVFDVPEERSLLMRHFTAVWLTIAVGALLCVAAFLITVGGDVAAAVNGGESFWLWQVTQYPVAILFLLLSFSLVYHFGPNIREVRWRPITPGAVLALGFWFMGTLSLRLYLSHFGSYTFDYGIIGAVMALLVWFYLAGLAFLVGGEIDAIIDRARTGKRKHYQHVPGARGYRNAHGRAA